MNRHGSERPSIDTSAEAVFRRLEREFDHEPPGIRDLARTRIRPLALMAFTAGAGLSAAAVIAPIAVAVLGGLIAISGVALATIVEDEDRVTGIGRARRTCRRGVHRLVGRRRSRDAPLPIGSRFALWLFPDPRKSRPR